MRRSLHTAALGAAIAILAVVIVPKVFSTIASETFQDSQCI